MHASRDRQVADLIASAHAAQQRGDGAFALRSLEQAVALVPDHAPALNSLGIISLGRRDFDAAASRFARAAEADPAAPALLVNLATAQRGRGDDDGERAALTKVLALDQRHLMANIRLAELHERRGEAALANFRWGAVIALAAHMPDRSPALDDLLRHAQSYVSARGSELGAIVDDGLAELRAGLAPAQTRRVDACVDAMLGRRRIYRNECAGLHVPFLPADEFFDRAAFPWLDQVEAETDAIREELEALLTPTLQGFDPYVSLDPGTPPNIWSPLSDSTDWSAYYLWRYGEPVADAQRRCPRTAALLATLPLADIPQRGPTAFFSILRPHTRLPAHTGVSNARAIIHLPLIVPPGCGFRVGGETRTWRIGEALAFDDTIEHEAWNDSDELRAVLIFDTWNPHLTDAERAVLRAFFATVQASGLDPGASAALAD